MQFAPRVAESDEDDEPDWWQPRNMLALAAIVLLIVGPRSPVTNLLIAASRSPTAVAPAKEVFFKMLPRGVQKQVLTSFLFLIR